MHAKPPNFTPRRSRCDKPHRRWMVPAVWFDVTSTELWSPRICADSTIDGIRHRLRLAIYSPTVPIRTTLSRLLIPLLLAAAAAETVILSSRQHLCYSGFILVMRRTCSGRCQLTFRLISTSSMHVTIPTLR
jgi:hypothetical protein